MRKLIFFISLLIAINISFAQSSNLNKISYAKSSMESTNTGSAIYYKLAIIGFASLIAFGVVFIRRNKVNLRLTRNSQKEKIIELRSEKIKYQMDPHLKMIRKKLRETFPASKARLEGCERSAKKLNISQEEINLAARLNLLHEDSNRGGYFA